MSNLYWFKFFQREGKVWQRIIEKVVKASVQVTMSAISMTRFSDPDTASFPSKNVRARFLELEYCLEVGQPGLQNALL